MNAEGIFSVSASGLSAQRMRMDVIAANLANAHSTSTPQGGAYKRRDVVLESVPASQGFEDLLFLGQDKGSAVRVARVVEDGHPGRRQYDPHHPHAGSDGYVELPNVNVVTEMVDLMGAARAYEANAAAINATKRITQAALDIGQA